MVKKAASHLWPIPESKTPSFLSLAMRIINLESEIGRIVAKIDGVFNKMQAMEKGKVIVASHRSKL